MINYALKIKEYRECKFFKQDELAKLLGVSKTSITRWETGKFEPAMQIKKRQIHKISSYIHLTR